MVLQSFLQQVIRDGDLRVRMPSGEVLRLGDGSGPPVAVAIASRRWALRLAANPSMALGEAYMDGGLVMETGRIHDLVDLIGRNAQYRPVKRAGPLARWWLDRRLHANARAAARRNVAHHYDLSVDFYRRFLDPDLQYSCAYFADPGMSLEEAQAAKKQHLAEPRARAWPDARGSRSPTTATSPGPTTGSSRSACSSMSADRISRPISTRWRGS